MKNNINEWTGGEQAFEEIELYRELKKIAIRYFIVFALGFILAFLVLS